MKILVEKSTVDNAILLFNIFSNIIENDGGMVGDNIKETLNHVIFNLKQEIVESGVE
jgi:hypothetical protein